VDLADNILDLSFSYYKEWNKNGKLDIKQLFQEFARKNPQVVSSTTASQKTDKDPPSDGNSPPHPCIYVGNSKGKEVFTIGGKLQVFIYRDNVVKTNGIDVLVSPENNAFTGSGALAQSILEAAGSQYRHQHQKKQQEVAHRKPLKPGDIHIIQGGNLKYKHVLHVVVNRFSKNHPPWPIELHEFKHILKHVFENLDALASCNMKKSNENVRLKSIAMPLLGAGKYKK
jgi:O-acetyl-ADP-ribose deacetylase (regulator of RNase III)